MAPNAENRSRQRYGAFGTGAVLAGVLAYVGLADPHNTAFFFPACPFNALTGLYCPGCGGLRMVHDVLHGDLAAAVVDNVFLLVGLPLLLTWFVVRWRQGKQVINAPVFAVVIVATATWAVVRNVPGFPLVPTVLQQ